MHGVRIRAEVLSVKADKNNLFDRSVMSEEPDSFAQRDLSGPVMRKAVDARTDGREGDRADAVLHGQCQAVTVTVRQQRILVVPTAIPDRPNRV